MTSHPRPGESAVLAPSLARSTAGMTALTAISRLTGFARVIVVAAVLGTTFLGNTYQTANTVPNLLFELFAAGVLQAALIPTLVELLDAGRRADAEHVAGSVLGLAAAGLAVLAGIGMLVAPFVMRGLVAGVDDPAIRDDQVRLGTVFLWFFLPQVVMYAAGMVATAVLNAHDRFALPAFAPVVNNVVVTASYGVFWWLRDGQPPSLDLDGPEILVLAGGTTVGVIAFTLVPVVAAVRSGFSLRPRFDHRHPMVRRVARLGFWAAAFLAMSQVLLGAVLVLANRVEGGVVAYQVGYTFFLLPHALFALPVLTALFPTLSRRSREADTEGFSASLAAGVRTITFFVVPAATALLVLAGSVTDVVLFGETSGAGADQVARVVVTLAPGVVGYGLFLYLTRAFAALGDTRTPALVHVAVTVGGVVLMVAGFALAPEGWEVPGVGAGYSAAYLAGTIALAGLLRGHLVAGALRRLAGPLAVTGVAAAVAAAVMGVASVVVEGDSRLARLVELATAGTLGALAYFALQALLGGMRLSGLVAQLRGTDR